MSVTDISEKIDEIDEQNKDKLLQMVSDMFDSNTPYGLFIFDDDGNRQVVSNLQVPALFWLLDAVKLGMLDNAAEEAEQVH
jgi:hypothetical protein